jgi:hypothetical protein
MTDYSWSAHTTYLEDEVKKLDERAGKLEEMITDPGKRAEEARVARTRQSSAG